MLLEKIFQQLPSATRDTMEPETMVGILANGTRMGMTSTVQAGVRFKHLIMEERFLIGPLEQGRIIGMPFLRRYDCSIVCNPPTLRIQGHTLRCTNREGRTLVEELSTGVWGIADTQKQKEQRSKSHADSGLGGRARDWPLALTKGQESKSHADSGPGGCVTDWPLALTGRQESRSDANSGQKERATDWPLPINKKKSKQLPSPFVRVGDSQA